MKSFIKTYSKFIVISIILILLIAILIVIGFRLNSKEIKSDNDNIVEVSKENDENYINEDEKGYIDNIQEINLHDIDGNEKNYLFTYKGENYSAIYTKDNWHIVDSYKITNEKDMEIICQALINIHPIHGKDKISFRNVQDLVYEWVQHNIAYNLLPEDNKWKTNAKDVDFNPEDQGKNLKDFYESRNGKILDKIEKVFNK